MIGFSRTFTLIVEAGFSAWLHPVFECEFQNDLRSALVVAKSANSCSRSVVEVEAAPDAAVVIEPDIVRL